MGLRERAVKHIKENRHTLEYLLSDTEKGPLRKAWEWVMPVFASYDPVGEAKQLIEEDEQVKQSGFTQHEVAGFCFKAYRENGKPIWYTSKIADGIDKLLSAPAGVIETIELAVSFVTTAFGGAPITLAMILQNLGEEGAEFVTKLPFYAVLYNDRLNQHRLWPMLVKEGATSAIPVVSDAYDMLNPYLKTARDSIRAYAREYVMDAIRDGKAPNVINVEAVDASVSAQDQRHAPPRPYAKGPEYAAPRKSRWPYDPPEPRRLEPPRKPSARRDRST